MIILFDNYNNHTACQSLWGFSAYFEEYKLLFDTGSNGRVLLKNMQELGVDVKEIKYMFITHSHWDHIGGIDSILELNPERRNHPALSHEHLIRVPLLVQLDPPLILFPSSRQVNPARSFSMDP